MKRRGKQGNGNPWDVFNPWSSNNPIRCSVSKNPNSITSRIFKANPAYQALQHGYNAYQLAQNPCSSNWSIVGQSAEALGYGIATAGTAASIAAAGSGLAEGGIDWGSDAGSIGGGYGKSQVPSWVFNEGYAAEVGESPVQAATRIMNERYGSGNWAKGPGTEFNQIVKWVSRTGGKP